MTKGYIFFTISYLVLLTSCTTELDQCQSELEEALSKIAVIQDLAYELESSIGNLRSEVDDFYYEDWRYYNMPQ